MIISDSGLVGFEATNLLSYRTGFEFSMRRSVSSEPVARFRIHGGASRRADIHPISGLVGPNAAGKTNLVRAIFQLQQLATDPAATVAHLADSAYDSSIPSSWTIEFYVGRVLHEYSIVADKRHILLESLAHAPNGTRSRVFERTPDALHSGRGMSPGVRAASEAITDARGTLLSQASDSENPVLRAAHWWLRDSLRPFGGSVRLTETYWLDAAIEILRSGTAEQRSMLLALIAGAGLGLSGARVYEASPRGPLLLVEHEDGQLTSPLECSRGTASWVSLAAAATRSLTEGSVLVADDYDTHLHPDLARFLADIYAGEESNPRLAQLVFTTRDTSTLGAYRPRSISRNQTWFVERSNGASRISPLAAQTTRSVDNVAKRYLGGEWGALPSIASTETIRLAYAPAIATPQLDQCPSCESKNYHTQNGRGRCFDCGWPLRQQGSGAVSA